MIHEDFVKSLRPRYDERSEPFLTGYGLHVKHKGEGASENSSTAESCKREAGSSTDSNWFDNGQHLHERPQWDSKPCNSGMYAWGGATSLRQ